VESIDSPGNLGTIVRTAEATGVAGIFLIGADADPFDPAAVRASMGSLFSQKLMKCTAREFTDWTRSSRVSVIASSPAGLLDYRALRYRRPVVLLMGSEKHGLSEHLIEISDFTVRLPMLGSCDSINVAVATGVLLYEIFNQRRKV
jgi:TrmH family RNA methyltransferase